MVYNPVFRYIWFMKLKLTVLLSFFTILNFQAQTDSAIIKKVDAMIEDFYNVTYNNPDSALSILDSAEAIAGKAGYPAGITSVVRQRGMFYSERGEYVKSMALLLKALKLDEQIGNNEGAAMDELYIGLNYFQHEKLNEALVYMKKAEKWYVDKKDEAGIALLSANLGMVHRNLNQFEKALQYYFAARDYYIRQHNDRNLEHVENNIGNIYKDLLQYDKALEHFLIAKEIVSKSNDKYYLVNSFSNIADVYVGKKEFNKAIDYYNQALKIARDQKSIALEKDVHFDLAYAYELMGDFKKAFENFKSYSTLKDSTISEKYNKDLADMKVKYDSEKKESENNVLKKDNELQEVKIRQERNQKLLFAFLLGLAFLAGSLVYVQYRNKKKLSRELALINEKVNSQNSTLRTLNKELIESEENLTKANETKDQLISMLSHDLYNPVTSVINYSSSIIEKSAELSREELVNSFEKINNAVVPLQDLLDNILQWARVQKNNLEPHPEEIDLNKIAAATVQLYSPAAAFKKITIGQQVSGSTVTKTDRLMLNFIFRNLVNNAVKFCPAGKKIDVEIRNQDDKLLIFVKDEGAGFSAEMLRKLNDKNSTETINAQGSGIGLSVSRQFVKLLNGEIEFRNQANGGAEVIVQLNRA